VSDQFKFVGENVSRVDARAKVTGTAQFAGDIVVPDMVHGKILRSYMPHATIKHIDASAAEALPGVITVLTGQDVLDIDPYYGHAIKDRPLIALDRVRFIGEPVAVAVAEDPATADKALGLIEVEYDELPAAATLETALAPDAPRLHDTSQPRPGLFHGLELKPETGNICYHHSIERDDVAESFAKADIVVEGDGRPVGRQ
jgi:CO/xanthine dehydrogenase Mo-binding subunit